jgi:hypothetical protein
MTFDDQGNPMMYKKPKVGKDIIENLEYNLDTQITRKTQQAYYSPSKASQQKRSNLIADNESMFKDKSVTLTRSNTNESTVQKGTPDKVDKSESGTQMFFA